MTKYIRCKVCGYTTKEGDIKGYCPACGAKAKAFEPYVLTISEKRKKMLDYHFHQIIVHFPQAYAPTLFLFLVVKLILIENALTTMDNIIKIAYLLIDTVFLLSIFTGLFDAKTRYKKLRTPFLKQKISVAISALILSIISSVLIFVFNSTKNLYIILILLNVLIIACSLFLGKTGVKLSTAVTRGK